MPTDAPDGNINAHVVRARRSDHVTPKQPRVRTHQPAPKPAATVVVQPEPASIVEPEPVKVEPETVLPKVEDKPKSVTKSIKKAAGKS